VTGRVGSQARAMTGSMSKINNSLFILKNTCKSALG
jgi:hypothetical protein